MSEMDVRIRQVPLNEDKAKSNITQVLLSDGNAETIKG